MNNIEFVNKCKWLVNEVPNYYYSGTDWLNYDKANGKFKMDCVLAIKGILWGFSANKNRSRGGAIYKSNGVADFTCNGALDYCNDVSTNFNNLGGMCYVLYGLISYLINIWYLVPMFQCNCSEN